MILAAWLLLATICCSSNVHSLSAPVPAAIGPNSHDVSASASSSEEEDSLAPPDKRILKYFLPSGQAWPASSDANLIRPTGQEGTKRGYNDKNFLRFGRGEAEKRSEGRNFLRFGRGGSSEEFDNDLEEDTSLSAEKRDRNFLRFGRDRNFLRFGRAGLEEFGHERGPLEFAQGFEAPEYPIEEDKRSHKNYLRFGRGDRNFLRFGRSASNNFLRFGRSVDRQTFCDDCDDDVMNNQPSATSSSSISIGHEMESPKHISPKDHSATENFKPSTARDADVHRSKRSALMYYDYAVIPSHGPIPWAMDFQNPSTDEEVEDSDMEDVQDVSKRSRNFLRFGRDRNFLRFGKRDSAASSPSSSGSNVIMVSPLQYPRFARAPFLRFG